MRNAKQYIVMNDEKVRVVFESDDKSIMFMDELFKKIADINNLLKHVNEFDLTIHTMEGYGND